ncbi:hypothetical protein PsAD37_01930 [Pseudovibrio sp. Ad37]|nr:hypothetical protein PsAD37_01930 [Pseudovibrio sp. Ad37]
MASTHSRSVQLVQVGSPLLTVVAVHCGVTREVIFQISIMIDQDELGFLNNGLTAHDLHDRLFYRVLVFLSQCEPFAAFIQRVSVSQCLLAAFTSAPTHMVYSSSFMGSCSKAGCSPVRMVASICWSELESLNCLTSSWSPMKLAPMIIAVRTFLAPF